MNNIYRDEIFALDQFYLSKNDDIFKEILTRRNNENDSKRFFLEYLPLDIAKRYDFNDQGSLKRFREDCLKYDNLLQLMGGCNLIKEELQKGIRYAGIKMSDPSGNILGSFHIDDGTIIYSPIFPHFYEERDNIKFANDIYFTTMTFEEIMTSQIELATKFYVHIGNYTTPREIIEHGKYIFKEISKEQMLEYVFDSNIGEKVLNKRK